MLRTLFLAGVFTFSLMGQGCQSQCKKMSKTNSKLISGKETFGLNRSSKIQWNS